ncbi:VOC family protein [Neptunicella marina]|uniref:VOC family protein n=1 Tax=Neptunicella marina TaxID=2125989 RepID=A0A8J6IYG2_9ALTE|nr:VOC family protein [Neptunicella marina]MBC3767418.1 VOC family protein [Neptunicella marina]
MQRVTGIGGIFFKAQDPKALREWYQAHLGIDIQDWGGAVLNASKAATNSNPRDNSIIWNISAADNDYYAPSQSPFMLNYRVADLQTLLQLLREEGCNVLDKTDESDFGKFAWVIDPEGNKIELWQPPAG